MPRKRRKFSQEFKEEAVRLCKQGDRSIAQVAKELDLTRSALERWVRQYDIDQGGGQTGPLTTEERAELRSLRRRVLVLEEEKEILKKAAAFFAKEDK